MSEMRSLNGASDYPSQYSGKRSRSFIPEIDSSMPSNHSFRHEVRIWTCDLLIALGVALFIIVFLYRPILVEGTSMAPLLCDQERIFINRFIYHFEPIERGDVVVFWYPSTARSLLLSALLPCPARPSKSGGAWSTSTGIRFLNPTSHHNTRM